MITVDPGIVGTGVAFWGINNVLRRTEIIKPKGKGIKRFDYLFRAMGDFIEYAIFDEFMEEGPIYCEEPTFMESYKGKVAARKGDLLTLNLSAAMIMAAAFHYNVQFELVPISKWKGTLPKEVVFERIRKIMGDKVTNVKSHALDAVGIGLYVQGRL